MTDWEEAEMSLNITTKMCLSFARAWELFHLQNTEQRQKMPAEKHQQQSQEFLQNVEIGTDITGSFPVTPPSAKKENYVLGSPGGFPGGLVVKNLPTMQELVGSILGSGRSPEGRHGNSLQYSCLGNPMDRGARQATVYGDHKLSS